MSKTVGIDLGTTNSLVAIVEQGCPRVLARGEECLIPSVVGLSDDGRIVVGQTALNQFVLAPERTVRSIKRRMGTDDRVKLGDREYKPEEISAFILRYLKTMAEEVLGEEVKSAVITVPAYFNDAQRTATQRAGELAGFEVKRIINEPTAAALAYGVEKQANQFLMIYDLGGGTFDVSIIEQQGDIMEVRASHGNVHLGGDDFDERLLQHLIAHLSSEHRYDFKADRRAMARLVRAAERTKVALSDAPYAAAKEEFLANYDGQIAHLNTELGRDQFEEMIDDLLRSTLDSIDKAMKDAQLNPEQINRVLLVGGSSRIPRVSAMIQERLNIEPAMEIDPDEAVALGAAVQAAIIDGEPVNAMLIDVAPHSLGIQIAQVMYGNLISGMFHPLIRRNTTIPATKSDRFYTLTPTQDTIEVKVYQGESPIAADNTLLGSFKFTDIPPNEDPDKNREIIVEFSYNLNGIVEVTARDRKGERREALTVSAATAKRSSAEPEIRHRFDPKTERDVKRALDSATAMELRLKADGKTKDAERLNQARHALEAAFKGDDEKQVMNALNGLDDVLYDLED